ncbi:uncharacterized protein LOC144622683 [Crassostrea virginica]
MMLQRLTILCFFFRIANSARCNREGGWVCCPGFVLNETTNECTPCPEGYYGTNCRPCSIPISEMIVLLCVTAVMVNNVTIYSDAQQHKVQDQRTGLPCHRLVYYRACLQRI